MKIIIEDFNHKGKHFDRYECEWPQVTDIDAVPLEKAIDYLAESLDELLKD